MKSPIIVSEKELPSVAGTLLKTFKDNTVFLFFGDMGAGKTTFIKAIISRLNVNDIISSPTFSIVNEYFSEKLQQPVYHFDFYRIKNEEEALNIGLEEYLYSGNLCFIEWPEKIENLLPENYVEIRIEKTDDKPDYRKITFKTK